MKSLKVSITLLFISFHIITRAQVMMSDPFFHNRYITMNYEAYYKMMNKTTIDMSMEQVLRNFDDYTKKNGLLGFNIKYDFRVIMKDGTVKIVKSKIQADTLTHVTYLVYIDKKLKKNDPNREQKIYPSQTKEISRLQYKANAFNNRIMDTSRITGYAADSCWLFKLLPGKISAYFFLSDSEMLDTHYLTAIKFGNKSIEKAQALEAYIKDNEKAYKAFLKKDYFKAIKQFNNSN